MKGPTREELLRRIKSLPPMTEEERKWQTLSFVYGNMMLSTNHKLTYRNGAYLADRLGISREDFARWAADRTWKDE
jgi:hypothetical protein